MGQMVLMQLENKAQLKVFHFLWNKICFHVLAWRDSASADSQQDSCLFFCLLMYILNSALFIQSQSTLAQRNLTGS